MITGHENDFDLEHRFFNGVCFFVFILGTISTTFNVLLGLDLILILSVVFGTTYVGALYLISKTIAKHRLRLLVWLLFGAAYFFLPVMWFTNGGIDGSIMLTYFVLLAFFVVITNGIDTYIFVLLLVINLVGVFILEFYHPELNIPYETTTQRYTDILYTAVSSMVIIALIINFIKNRFIIEKSKAEESNLLKSTFLANMSHEIRTPMNSILGFSELLAEDDLEDHKKIEYANIIKHNGKHLLRIINDIIDISKIEAGQIKIKESFFSLNKLIDETENATILRERMQEKRNLVIKTSKGLDDLKSIIKSDAIRLRQILTNLIDNAIKFTENGTVEFGYNLSESREKIVFFVKDSGIGIPENKVESVFERFRQADESVSKRFEGAGLGLSICRGLVELLGGDIYLESKVGEGSVFYFTIPYITDIRSS